jgi:hypothetical protein
MMHGQQNIKFSPLVWLNTFFISPGDGRTVYLQMTSEVNEIMYE